LRNELMRVMLFTMILLQHAFIARASLFTDFCPTIDAISLPDEKSQWDADGFPQFFTLDLSNWKGNTKRRRQVRAPLPAAHAVSPAAPRHAALHRAAPRRAALLRLSGCGTRPASHSFLTSCSLADGVR
jgi:hypothetical protein